MTIALTECGPWAHPKVASERLGLAAIATTRYTSSHAIPAMLEEAAALIAGLVFAGSRGGRRPPHPAASGLL